MIAKLLNVVKFIIIKAVSWMVEVNGGRCNVRGRMCESTYIHL